MLKTKIEKPKGNWQKPFMEIVLRAIRKANFDFESWDINQTPRKLSDNDFVCLNSGWGVFKAPEEHTCAYITQEFAASPFTKGYWVAKDKDGILDHRWYMIEREVKVYIKNIYPCKDTKFKKWSTRPNYKTKQNDASLELRWVDILTNRIGYNKDFEIEIKWKPTFIEAKRMTVIEGKISLNPNLNQLKSNIEEVKKDIRKLLGLKIAFEKNNVEFDHPNEKGIKTDFIPSILFWGFDKHCNQMLEEILKNPVSIEYDGEKFETIKWTKLVKEYPYQILDNDKIKKRKLKIVLLQFDYVSKGKMANVGSIDPKKNKSKVNDQAS